MSRTVLTLATASLLTFGSMAQAQTMHPLSIANEPAVQRAGADLQGGSELRGTAKWVVGAVVLGLLIWGVIELTSDDEEAFPVSP